MDPSGVAHALADKARTIRVPVHIVEKLNKIGRAGRKLVTGLGREPTPGEIAEVIGIDPRKVEAVKLSVERPPDLVQRARVPRCPPPSPKRSSSTRRSR